MDARFIQNLEIEVDGSTVKLELWVNEDGHHYAVDQAYIDRVSPVVHDPYDGEEIHLDAEASQKAQNEAAEQSDEEAA